jgi:RNA polymerase sigma-70 factor (ECF subfamily)
MGLNLARDFLRKAKRHPVESYESENGFSTEANPDDALSERLDARQVQEALQTLPVDYREALLLRFHEGLSVGEVAQTLGISLSAAKMKIHRGLSKLRQVLARR